jgi:coproporphyrinogen III oxidase-like Fe-S oxidoreductase
LLLGLRLDEPLAVVDVDDALDTDALERLVGGGLVERSDAELALTRRGRFLGGAVTAELVAGVPD